MVGREGTGRTRGTSGLDTTVDPFSNLRGARKLSREVLDSIQSLGYAHIKQHLTAEDFDLLAQQLGSIALRTDLAIAHNRSSIVYKPDEIAFHQDNPVMNILGWYCVRQDEFDGSARLLDSGDVANHFSPSDIKIMSRVNVRYPDPDPSRHNPDKGLIAYLLWPLITEKDTRCEVYYVPWLLLDSYDEEQTRVIKQFAEYLRAKEQNQVVRIRLSEGESLFIDNKRMLHGRGPMQQDSKRFLKRVWIKGNN
jgi:Taurine catabolism dioxygenase TauD, TfdA family